MGNRGATSCGGYVFFRPAAAAGLCECKSSINSAVDIGTSILEYFDQAAKGGQLDNPVAGFIDFFVLELPGMRMRNENRAQTGGDRGIDVRARTVADHKRQRRIQVGVAHEAAISVHVL